MKKLVTQLLVFALYFQSMSIILMTKSLALDFDPFQASSQVFDDGSGAVGLDDDTLDQLTEDELIFATLARDMRRSFGLCKEKGGAAGFKLGVIDDPELKNQDGSPKQINCNQVAKFMFDLEAGSGDPNTHNPAFACVTHGWDYDTKLDFYREFMDDIEAVGLEAEKEFNCPGKNETMGECIAAVVCGAFIGSIPVVGQLLNSPLVDKHLTGGNGCSKYNKTNGQSCFTNLLWGAWKSIVGNIEGIWDLLGLGWDALKGIGKAAWEGTKTAGRAIWNWATPDSWNIPDPEDKARDTMHALEQQSDGFFSRFLKDPGGTVKGFVSNFMSGIMKMVQDGAVNNFGCLNFPSPESVGGDFLGETGGKAAGLIAGKVKCKGKDRWVSAECASCSQWTNVMCGVGGFLGGEIINSLFMGKAFSYLGKGIKFAGAADDVTKAALKMADATGDFSKITKGMMLRKAVGDGANWLAKHIGESRALALTKWAGGGVIKGLTVMAEMGGGLIKVVAVTLPGGVIKKAIMYGGKILNLTDDKIAQILKFVRTGGGKLKNAALALPKGYLKMMDDAFVLGFKGKAGLKMLRNSRNIEKITEGQNFLKGLEGADDFADISRLHDEAMDAMRQYEAVAKQAKRAHEAGNMDEFTRLMGKLDDLDKAHKSKVALAASKADDARISLKVKADMAAAQKAKNADKVADASGNPGVVNGALNSADNVGSGVTKLDDVADAGTVARRADDFDISKITKTDDGQELLHVDRGFGRGTSTRRGTRTFEKSIPDSQMSKALDSSKAKALKLTDDQESLISAYAKTLPDKEKQEMMDAIIKGNLDDVRKACR